MRRKKKKALKRKEKKELTAKEKVKREEEQLGKKYIKIPKKKIKDYFEMAKKLKKKAEKERRVLLSLMIIPPLTDKEMELCRSENF